MKKADSNKAHKFVMKCQVFMNVNQTSLNKVSFIVVVVAIIIIIIIIINMLSTDTLENTIIKEELNFSYLIFISCNVKCYHA